MLSIPYYVVNHQERFERDVIRPFVDDISLGDAHPVQSVQQPPQVRSVASDRQADRRGTDCYRPLRT